MLVVLRIIRDAAAEVKGIRPVCSNDPTWWAAVAHRYVAGYATLHSIGRFQRMP